MEHGKCKVCSQETNIFHNTHGGTETEKNPDGSKYESDWYCQKHLAKILLDEIKEFDEKSGKGNDSITTNKKPGLMKYLLLIPIFILVIFIWFIYYSQLNNI